jgi:hypothetical protein
MISLRVRSVDAKRIRISGIHPLLAVCLQELPLILELRDKEPVRARLFPPPTVEDTAANREWQESIEPDLRHLFVSAGETVVRDLTGLAPQPRAPARLCVTISAMHVNAWMSAINQARLILGVLFGIVDEQDMRIADLDSHNPRHVAIVKIELLGELLGRFVELETGERAGLTSRSRKKTNIKKRVTQRKNSTPKKKRKR